MKSIKLPNRDGADLQLEFIEDIDSNITKWKLTVDSAHEYVLDYCRMVGFHNSENGEWSKIDAIDPIGGPFISINNEYEKYKIIKINSDKSILMSEKH